MPVDPYLRIEETPEQAARRRAARAADSAAAMAALYRGWAREEPDRDRRRAHNASAVEFSELADLHTALARAGGSGKRGPP